MTLLSPNKIRLLIVLYDVVDRYPKVVCNVAELLMTHGATANDQARDGLTPLHCATQNDFEDLYALLLRNGAHITLPWKRKTGDERTISIGGRGTPRASRRQGGFTYEEEDSNVS